MRLDSLIELAVQITGFSKRARSWELTNCINYKTFHNITRVCGLKFTSKFIVSSATDRNFMNFWKQQQLPSVYNTIKQVFRMCIKIETALKTAPSQQRKHDETAAWQTQVEKDLQDICQRYKDDLDPCKPFWQLEVPSDVCQNGKTNTVQDVASCLMKYPSMYDEVSSEVSRLVQFTLVIPATSATAERSFSTLRHPKTYSRSTMTA